MAFTAAFRMILELNGPSVSGAAECPTETGPHPGRDELLRRPEIEGEDAAGHAIILLASSFALALAMFWSCSFQS